MKHTVSFENSHRTTFTIVQSNRTHVTPFTRLSFRLSKRDQKKKKKKGHFLSSTIEGKRKESVVFCRDRYMTLSEPSCLQGEISILTQKSHQPDVVRKHLFKTIL